MNCPICNVFQYKKMWSTTQWHFENPLHDGLIGCKNCRDQPPAILPGFADKVKRACGVLWKADRQIDALQVLAAFITQYLSEIPKNVRKALSHEGALRSFEGSPVHWLMEKEQCFDPGNKVYHLSMQLLFPNEDFILYLNEESVGDFCEGILAFRYRKISKCQCFVVRFLEVYCSAVWQLCTYRNVGSLKELRGVMNEYYGCPLFSSIM
jgi:hypothetical protein